VTWERLRRKTREQAGDGDGGADQDSVDDAQAAQTGVPLR
jgi:hypothetical protein